MDAVNIPSDSESVYESLIFEIIALPPGIGSPPRRSHAAALKSRLNDDLVEAVAHAASAIAGATACDDIKALSLVEMLALIRSDPAAAIGHRLASAGPHFRAILTAARMEPARRLINEVMGPGAAAQPAGHASRVHFARQYRAAFGGFSSSRA